MTSTETIDIAAITRQAARAGRGPADLLAGYLETLVSTARTGRRLTPRRLATVRASGAEAADRGFTLSSLVDLYLHATWLTWRALPDTGTGESHRAADAVLRAANDAIVALTDGFETAQRATIRRETTIRREFVDDLLHGGSNPSRLAERAARFGLHLTGIHVVAAVASPTPHLDAADSTRRLETQLSQRLGAHQTLVTTKDDLLVCIASGSDHTAVDILSDELHAVTAATEPSRIAIGRPHGGPSGVARSYQEARTTLELATRLRLDAVVVRAADLLVYQVLFRDRTAMTELVAAVLTPLSTARGGAQPLLDTLNAYFGDGTAAGAARRLHLSVRALTYRLARVHRLTGYDATDGTHRMTLQTATLGAQLLNWPAEPLHRHP